MFNLKILIALLTITGSAHAAGKVTNSTLANMAQSTIKGRAASSGTGAPVDLSATQATAILNNMVGDSGSGGTKGLAPAPASGDAAADKYLHADGTWKIVAGTGAASTVYIKDVKSAGSHGGSSTSGSWQTRTLNTTEGDTGIVSLSSNQFTLQAGTYEIEAYCPARDSDKHRCKLRNITDSTDDLLGTSSDVAVTGVTTNSVILGRITIAGAKVFEIQHRVTSSASTTGYGSATNVSISEVYTVVKIVQY